MSQEKKLVLFFAIVFIWMIGATQFSRFMGWLPAPKKPPVVGANDAKFKPLPLPDEPDPKANAKAKPEADPAVAKAEADPAAAKAKGLAKTETEPAGKKPAAPPEIELVNESELVLGSTKDRGPGAYRIRVQLDQKGAGVDSVDSALYDAEFEFGKPRKRPLEFITRDPKTLPSLALTLGQGTQLRQGHCRGGRRRRPRQGRSAPRRGGSRGAARFRAVGRRPRERQGRSHRDRARTPRPKHPLTGQAVVFRTTAKSGVVRHQDLPAFPRYGRLRARAQVREPGKRAVDRLPLARPSRHTDRGHLVHRHVP